MTELFIFEVWESKTKSYMSPAQQKNKLTYNHSSANFDFYDILHNVSLLEWQ